MHQVSFFTEATLIEIGVYRYGKRAPTSNSKTRILSTPVCVTYVDRGILISNTLGHNGNILEHFPDEVRFCYDPFKITCYDSGCCDCNKVIK